MVGGRSTTVVFVVLAVLAFAPVLGGGTTQTNGAPPTWSDEVFEHVESTVEAYNARDGDPGLLESWVLGNARVNLHVSDDGGARAVYSLRLDADSRVTDLERGPLEDPTLRVETTRATVDQIATTADPGAEVIRGVRDGRIRVERVFAPAPGLALAIGVEDVAIGVGSVVVVSLAVAKVGFDTTLSFLRRLVRRLIGVVRGAWQSLKGIGLGGIATLLTILDMLGLLDPLRRFIEWVRKAIRRALDALRPRDPPSNREPDERSQ